MKAIWQKKNCSQLLPIIWKIGFGNQPYLIYQHFDAAHPHIHIVTTSIEADGKRIDLHNLAICKSEPARKSIAKVFNLIVAEDQKKLKAFRLKPVFVGEVAYGKSETKMAIQNMLESVLGQYKYTSLHELNAVLNQYNVHADRGSEDSRIYKMGGLQYRVLNDEGISVGVPIKASHFYNKPTFKFPDQ